MIVAAAIRVNGLILSLPRPYRHHDIIKHAADLRIKELLFDQGFLTSDVEYVDRGVAKFLAKEAGQEFLTERSELFSEDLW